MLKEMKEVMEWAINNCERLGKGDYKDDFELYLNNKFGELEIQEAEVEEIEKEAIKLLSTFKAEIKMCEKEQKGFDEADKDGFERKFIREITFLW